MAARVSDARGTQTPPEPPDGRGEGLSKKSVSFRDKLMGVEESLPRREKVDLIGQKLFTVKLDGGDRLRPKCYINDKVLEELRLPWKEAVIVKLLGKSLGYFTMRDRLKVTWKLSGGFDIMDVGNGFFMVKFDLPVDKEKVINDGPWMIFYHCLAVRTWVPDFVSSDVKIDKTLVWIRFPNLGMEYYDESVLWALASVVGCPVKIDLKTVEASRGRFARVCVEVRLDIPVVGHVWLRDHWYRVEYEGLHLLCKKCGCFGHIGRNCDQPAVQLVVVTEKENEVAAAKHHAEGEHASNPNPSHEVEHNQQSEDLYGDWISVTKVKKHPKSKQRHRGGNNVVNNGGRDSRQAGTDANPFKILCANDEVGPRGNSSHVGTISVQPFVSGPGNAKSKVWQRKKRTRTEPTPNTKNVVGHGPTTFELGNTSKGTSPNVVAPQVGQDKDQHVKRGTSESKGEEKENIVREKSPTQPNPRAHDLKTSMHVEVIAPNHIRLLDDNDPPHPHDAANRKYGVEEDHADMEESEEDEEDDVESVDIVEETPTQHDF